MKRAFVDPMDSSKTFYERLDQEEAEQAERHRHALAAAALTHQRVREDAERAAQLRILLEEQDRSRREHEERQMLERLHAQAREEEHARLLQAEEEKKAQEERLRRLEAERVKVEEERRDIERKRKEQADKAAEEAAKAVAEEEARAQALSVKKAEATPKLSSQSNGQITQPRSVQNGNSDSVTVAVADAEKTHEAYLAIHKALKNVRKYMKDNKKSLPFNANRMSDMRREIMKTVGQYTIGPASKVSNHKLTKRLQGLLEEAKATAGPTIDLRQFTYNSPPTGTPDTAIQVPMLLIFLVNHFSKSVVNYFAEKCGGQLELAEPVGIATATLFGSEAGRWQGLSLFDIFLAKYHVECPIIFGIVGTPKTEAGRKRLGWRREGFPDKTFIPEQQHLERMTGLGAGYTSFSLRNFPKSLVNPYPPSNFWRTMAYILNVPPGQATSSHFTVLKGLLRYAPARFIKQYGRAALVVLRTAIVTFPQQQALNDASQGAVTTLKDVFQREFDLRLD